jgi:leader peptidase (prepilin peptidase)/N-methyltransferase
MYPLVESLSALLPIIIVLKFGVSMQSAALLLFTWGIITLSFIDLKHQILPDNLTIGLLWLGLLANAIPLFTLPSDAIIAAISGYLLLWIVAKIFFYIRKKDGMGYGDFKMLAMLGAWFGLAALLNILLTSAVLGACVTLIALALKKTTHDKPIPFGPFLAIAGWLTIVFGPTLTLLLTHV